MVRSRNSAFQFGEVDLQAVADGVAQRHARVEGCHRVLEDDLHAPSYLTHLLTAESGQVDAVKTHRALGGGIQVEHAPAGGGLAAAALAGQTQGLLRAGY